MAFDLRLTMAFLTLSLFLAAPGAQAETTTPMKFTIIAGAGACPSCIVINAAGEILEDTAKTFTQFIVRNQNSGALPAPGRSMAAAPTVIVAFDSPGGKVTAALIMGRRLRELGWITVIGSAVKRPEGVVIEGAGCFSACTMAMLGGVRRYIAEGSHGGVHQFTPRFEDNETFTPADANEIVRNYGRQVVNVYDYVQEMRVATDFFVTTMRTPYASMDELAPARLLAIGLITETLPAAPETSVAAILAAGPSPAAAVAPVTNGDWTLVRMQGAAAYALYVSDKARASLRCAPDGKAITIEFSFKNLGSVGLEQIRAAAYANHRLLLPGASLPIIDIAPAGKGEQTVTAQIDNPLLKSVLSRSPSVSVSVIDAQESPVGRATPISMAGAAPVLDDILKSCGG